MTLNINNLKKYTKLFIVGILILYALYIVYILTNTSIENFNNINDCSDCIMNPINKNCYKIQDFSFDNIDNTLLFNVFDTSYMFCPWEANCIGNNIQDNMLSQQARQLLNNSNTESGIINTTCCSGAEYSL